MNRLSTRLSVTLGAVLASAGAAHGAVNLLTNGGFELGLTGWTTVDQLGSEGVFVSQTGANSPVNSLAVASPVEGTRAAMTDSAGPGSHVLYQDFVVPASVPQAAVLFSTFVHNYATAFSTPASSDFSTPTLNQQARVDLMLTSASVFSVAPADILQNLYRTQVGDSLVSGYTERLVDITATLAAHLGETLRLRISEVDNVNIFNFGVDAAGVYVPTPSAAVIVLLTGIRSRRRTR